MSPFVLQAADLPVYSPANHTGTANQRIIGRDTVGARYVEVLLGTISRGHGAQPHAHPTLEQASMLLSGEGVIELPGRRRRLAEGDWCFNAMGVFHRFEVVSEAPAQVMVVYAPPYSENPHAAVTTGSAADPRFQEGAEQVRDLPAVVQAVDLPGYAQARVLPVITRQTVGARFLDIHAIEMPAGIGAAPPAQLLAEQVFFVRQGALQGRIGEEPFIAPAPSWVFVPEGAALVLDGGDAPCSLVLIRAQGDRPDGLTTDMKNAGDKR